MHRPVRRSLAVVVAALVALSACGGGGDDAAATPTTEKPTSTSTTTEASATPDEAADVDPASDGPQQADPAEVDDAIENCLGGDLIACLFLGAVGAQVPSQIEPDDDQRNATDDQIRTECFDFEILSACYEAGVRQLGQNGDDGIPPDDIGETLTSGCAGGDPDACLELGQRKFPPPSSFAGSFQDEPDLTVQFECFEVGVQEACYEAGLRNIDADSAIGE